MTVETALLALGAGFLVAVVTTPVGVSGAVFLLPIQLDILRIPSPAVTPTNLLFNVVSTPGALLRYRSVRALGGPLTRHILIGTLPGVVIGTIVRIWLAPGDRVFRLLAAALLLPLGIWLCLGNRTRPGPGPGPGRTLPAPIVAAVGTGAGVAGGIYGIGGGSLLGPILVGTGMSVAVVAPAALTATFLTSVAGVLTYAVLSLITASPVSPEWAIGLLCGAGGLIGGYVGAQLQPSIPERALRTLLGILALGLATTYMVQALMA
ncbi:sulfite exporter TauE/SafE family protein [Pseudonocardia sp. NPDC049635]|uniref:sulfite exporter TauE/SafE family protein n=1 Tax=Pseudonocardia sp. NPDC049635 TaxID=3155506 RepID=UPI00340D69A7